MRVAALIPLVGCICNVLLAIFVLLRAPRAVRNRVFFLLGLFISVWNLGQFFNFTTTSSESALLWVRIVWLGVIFIPMLLFHLSMLTAGIRLGKLIPAGYTLLALLAVTLPTDFFIKGVRHLGTAGWYAVPSLGLHLANLPFALMFVAIVVLIRKRRTISRLRRPPYTALIIAQSLLAVLGTNDTLPLNGFDTYPMTQIPVYPYGSIAAVFYGVIVAFSVLQHDLLDVQINLSRVAAQFVRMAFLTVTTLALLLACTLFFPQAFTFVSLWISLGVFVISIVFASVVFPRLLDMEGVEKLERRILGDHFEYQDRVRSFVGNISFYTDLPPLLNDLHNLLTMTIHMRSYEIILRDEMSRAFTVARAHPEDIHRHPPHLNFSVSAFRYFELKKVDYLVLGAANSGSRDLSHLEKQAREHFGRFSAEICFPLLWENEPFGLLFVGGKVNGDPYTATDIALLVSLVKSMSVTVNQLRLKNQIMLAQELDLLGRMSRGMAHDLNNLLTPVWTLLQLTTETGNTEPVNDELLPVALRNVKTMLAYIKEALFFSENLRPDFQLGRLDLVIRQAADVARASRKKDIEIIPDTPEETLVEMDEVLVQRLLANLISNAIDASPAGGQIRVHLERIAKSEAGREWMRIRVIDHGEGIPKENLERILKPYFTTKNRGDETRGFGLGLAISRKIVNLHNGQLNVQSQARKGTTVQINLPARQPKPEYSEVEETIA